MGGRLASESALGQDFGLWGASLLVRGEGQSHPWHTDMETHLGDGFGSLWIGIHNTSKDTSLKFVPGSHRFGRTVQEARALRQMPRDAVLDEDILEMAREHEPSPMIEQPACQDGDGVLFDGRIWHGSHNAASGGPRVALLLQYAKSTQPVRTVDFSSLDWPIRVLERRIPAIPVAGLMDARINDVVAPPLNYLGELRFLARQLSLPLALRESGWQPHAILQGSTANLRALACHASVLAPGKSPHPPHHHLEEEVLIVIGGEAELVLPAGGGDQSPRRERLRRGDFAYYPAYRWHTLVNVGTGPLSYLMFKWAGPLVASTEPNPPSLPTVVHRLAAPSVPTKGFFASLLLEGQTSFLRRLHAHATMLQPSAGYDQHADAHDVAIIVLHGRVSVNGQQAGPGGFFFCPAGIEHDMRNVGAEVARYLVFEFLGPEGNLRPT